MLTGGSRFDDGDRRRGQARARHHDPVRDDGRRLLHPALRGTAADLVARLGRGLPGPQRFPGCAARRPVRRTTTAAGRRRRSTRRSARRRLPPIRSRRRRPSTAPRRSSATRSRSCRSRTGRAGRCPGPACSAPVRTGSVSFGWRGSHGPIDAPAAGRRRDGRPRCVGRRRPRRSSAATLGDVRDADRDVGVRQGRRRSASRSPSTRALDRVGAAHHDAPTRSARLSSRSRRPPLARTTLTHVSTRRGRPHPPEHDDGGALATGLRRGHGPSSSSGPRSADPYADDRFDWKTETGSTRPRPLVRGQRRVRRAGAQDRRGRRRETSASSSASPRPSRSTSSSTPTRTPSTTRSGRARARTSAARRSPRSGRCSRSSRRPRSTMRGSASSSPTS